MALPQWIEDNLKRAKGKPDQPLLPLAVPDQPLLPWIIEMCRVYTDAAKSMWREGAPCKAIIDQLEFNLKTIIKRIEDEGVYVKPSTT